MSEDIVTPASETLPGLKFKRGSNSVGRVTAFQAVGRGFESRLPLLSEEPLRKGIGYRPAPSGPDEMRRMGHSTCASVFFFNIVSAHVAQLVEQRLGKA